jgi:hypothetical protein
MLTLPFHGWALAFAPACNAVSGAQLPAIKHPCCAEKKVCTEHKASPSHDRQQSAACGGGAACQCSSAVSMTAQPFAVFASVMPATPQADIHLQAIYSQSPPPFRPPIHS